MGQGMRTPTPVIDRFLKRTSPGLNGCIEWTGATQGTGYGVIKLGPSEGKRQVYVHRWAYEHYVAPIPNGYQIDHLCRNTLCVNVDHLEAVTPGVNTRRSTNPTAINARKTHCIHGHEFTPENTYTYGGRRDCKACRKTNTDRNYRKRTALNFGESA